MKNNKTRLLHLAVETARQGKYARGCLRACGYRSSNEPQRLIDKIPEHLSNIKHLPQGFVPVHKLLKQA
jgi:hypothetical protein